IGEVPELSPLSAEYTNTASVTGKITLDSAAVAYVYGSFSADSKFTNTVVSTEYLMEDKTYLTLYADSNTTETIPRLFEGQLKDITIRDWNNERYLRGDWLKDNLTKTIGEKDWKSVYADYSFKQYKVTWTHVLSDRSAVCIRQRQMKSLTEVRYAAFTAFSLAAVLRKHMSGPAPRRAK
ncbi:MAG: hypothetical protein LBJ20_01235, partial [Candidatus Methanoplasma sp.]|nr:hypothetical protein [Candidatus Methanoplasma sp.]